MNGNTPDGATILMVDDNATNLQILFKTLQQTGHRLLAARSGEEALQTAEKARPDLILLDIMMPPGIDGYETIQRLKADEGLRETPVIFLSSLDDTSNKVRGLELGAVDFVTKPFQAEEVIARVQTHLTINRLQADLADRNAQLEAANQRMKHDLDAAGRVQQALLPTTLPECEGYGFGWAYKPCNELGGDALDVFRINDEVIAFYLLDVSGHGVPASLLAVTATRSLAPRCDRSSLVIEPGWDPGTYSAVAPDEVMRRLNVMNPMDPPRNPHFITMIYGLLEPQHGRVRYACAGHPGPIVVRADGSATIVDGGSAPVGLVPNSQFEVMQIDLEPGDRLFIHSDGLYEQKSQDTLEQFGRERLRSGLQQAEGDVQQAVDHTVEVVRRWSGSDQLDDDLSLLGIGRV